MKRGTSQRSGMRALPKFVREPQHLYHAGATRATRSGGCPHISSTIVTHMHELSIAVDLIETASEEVARLGPVRVIAVRLKLGPLSGVVKEALLFSFDVAVSGTPLEGARLDIDDVPVSVWCGRCEAERELADLTRRRCPTCGSPTPRVIRGGELELIGLEIQDP